MTKVIEFDFVAARKKREREALSDRITAENKVKSDKEGQRLIIERLKRKKGLKEDEEVETDDA